MNMYFVELLETKSVEETVPATQRIVNRVNVIYQCPAVYMIHAD